VSDERETEERRDGPRPVGYVGVGASAGGLKALKAFFSGVTSDTGLAFIVITHLHRETPSVLPELLARQTEMPVRLVKSGELAMAAHIYLAPPGERLELRDGHLLLTGGGGVGESTLLIDALFRSLAEDAGSRAAGVVLSGTGSDGTLGAMAIKSAGGLVMVQDPADAEFKDMPGSAIAAAAVDFIRRADGLGEVLVGFYQREPRSEGELKPSQVQQLERLLRLLQEHTGHDFSGYKRNTVCRRIERRLNIHHLSDLGQYLQLIRETPHELDLLFHDLLIGVTYFFREPQAFTALGAALEARLEAAPAQQSLRVWVAGCSTGEEAYSIAMLIQDVTERLKRDISSQIFATDLDPRSIAVARAGRYPAGIAADVPHHYLERYFIREDSGYRVTRELRERVVFAPQNVLSDPPFTRLDLLSCRNLLIYLDRTLQERLFTMFHYALQPGGLLLLGNSESVGEFPEFFEPVNQKLRLFRRAESVRPRLSIPLLSTDFREPAPGGPPGASDALRVRIERGMLEVFAPPSVIINERGDIVHIHGRTGRWLEPAQGAPSYNLMRMAREGLASVLAVLISRANSRPGEAIKREVSVGTDGDGERVDISARRLTEPEELQGLVLLSFRSASPPLVAEERPEDIDKDSQLNLLEQELRYSKESHQSTTEELETTNEELQSTNEELQSTNEELQSANEELETSKEEMQSLNQELRTVNAELQARISDLSQVKDDMKNLLNSSQVATIFLDDHLNIKRFTPQAREVISVIDSDIGRPVGDLVSRLEYTGLVADARSVLDSLVRVEIEVRSRAGAWYLLRILPYRTSDNVISGLVLTFNDISKSKRADAYAEALVKDAPVPLAVLDARLQILAANPAFSSALGLSGGDIASDNLAKHLDPQAGWASLRRGLEGVFSRNEAMRERFTLGDGDGVREMVLSARRLHLDDPAGARALLIAGEWLPEEAV
jgi:two-component system CheB/CheR fusion protein